MLILFALLVAFVVLPLDLWALPFRAAAALGRACRHACDRLAVWAFPRR